MGGSDGRVTASLAAAALGALRWSVAVDPSHAALASASLKAVSVERRCTHDVQLVNDVLTAAEHTVEAWEAAMGA